MFIKVLSEFHIMLTACFSIKISYKKIKKLKSLIRLHDLLISMTTLIE